MKKKILVSVALVMLVAMCALTFVACTPSSVGSYLDALTKTKCGTIEMIDGGVTLAFDGDNMHVSMTIGETTSDAYIIVKGKSKLMYTNIGGVWTKTDATATIDAMLKNFDITKILSGVDNDKNNYDIKDGIWTEKSTGVVLKVEDGKLVLYNVSVIDKKEVKFMSIDVSKPSMTLPDGAKALDK